jgi:predicted component of type VI protein secretion system
VRRFPFTASYARSSLSPLGCGGGDEATAGYHLVPIARIIEVGTDRRVMLDENFIPALLRAQSKFGPQDKTGILTLRIAGSFPNLAMTLWALKR